MKKILQKTLFALFLFASIMFAQESVRFETISEPGARLTTSWMFVVDTSASMERCFEKSRVAFLEATKCPTDELKFGVVTFNNEFNQEVMKLDVNGDFRTNWHPATVDNFRKTEEWIRGHCGVRSFGAKAMKIALSAPRKNLTVVLISDGGFSDGFTAVDSAIESTQQWRLNNGYGYAIITSIGIENLYYTAGGKQPDADCQAFLKGIGEKWCGGYFLVHGVVQ